MIFSNEIGLSAAIAIPVSVLAFQASGVEVAAATFIALLSLVFFSINAGITDSMAAIKHPFVAFFIVLPGAFAYFALQGDGFYTVLGKALGISFLWGAVSMVIYKIWSF